MKRRKQRAWTGRWSLTHRILAVNILTVVILALGVIYLDVFRNKLSKERVNRTAREAQITAIIVENVPADRRAETLAEIGQSTRSRIRLYDSSGALIADSWSATGPTYRLRDPATERWTKDAARALDRGFNALVGAEPVSDFQEPHVDRLEAWPEALAARQSRSVVERQ